MKNFLRTSLASITLAVSAVHLRAASATTPYLETASVTFQCNFTITGIASTRDPVPVGGIGSINPDSLRPVDRVTTDIATLINYAPSNGDQAFFVKHLLRAATERFAQEYKTIAVARAEALAEVVAEIADLEENLAAINAQLEVTTDPDARTALNAQKASVTASIETKTNEAAVIAAPYDSQLAVIDAKLEYLKLESSDQWEIMSVRNAQASIAGATSTPFALFLSRTERTKRGITYTFDTGLRLTPIYSAGNSSETLSSGTLTKVTGNYVTHLSLSFESLYASDPLSSIDPESRAAAVDGKDYNTSAEYWETDASGYMSYTLRSTPGPIVAVYPSNIKLSGHGSWEHYPQAEADAPFYAGVAPFAIKIGAVKYQNKNVFPEFTGE
jgi:hypothetical protein